MTTYIINDLLSDAATDARYDAFGIGHRAYDNLCFLGESRHSAGSNSIDFEIDFGER